MFLFSISAEKSFCRESPQECTPPRRAKNFNAPQNPSSAFFRLSPVDLFGYPGTGRHRSFLKTPKKIFASRCTGDFRKVSATLWRQAVCALAVPPYKKAPDMILLIIKDKRDHIGRPSEATAEVQRLPSEHDLIPWRQESHEEP